MKLVDRETFLTLPPGTFYAKGVPFAFDGLAIKHETEGNDWWSLHPCYVQATDTDEAIDRLELMLSEGASFPMEDSIDRDGPRGPEDPKPVFLIFEQADLLSLRAMIDQALEATQQQEETGTMKIGQRFEWIAGSGGEEIWRYTYDAKNEALRKAPVDKHLIAVVAIGKAEAIVDLLREGAWQIAYEPESKTTTTSSR